MNDERGNASPAGSRNSNSRNSSVSTIYFEFQRNAREHVYEADHDVEAIPKTLLERLANNWLPILVIGFLLVITLVCALVPVRLASLIHLDRI